MSRYSIQDFVAKTSQKEKGEGFFELESDRLLEININGTVWTKTGSMIAYLGGIKFTREGILEHGLGKFFKKAISGEGTKLTKAEGMPGDRWSQNDSPKPEQQLATMQADVAETIANGQPIGLFGDNLFFDLDLSESNLPVGTQLRAGEALLEVSPEPHDGCLKFKARFGQDALRLVSRKQGRGRNLRGIYLTVVEDGELAAGDPIEVLRQV